MLLIAFLVAVEALLLAVEDEIPHVVEVLGRQNREEELSGARPALRVLVREVLSHSLHLDARVVQLGDGDFVVFRRVADRDVLHLQQLLLLIQDLLEELRRHHVLRRHVVLSKMKRSEEEAIRLTIAPSCTSRRNACPRSCRRGPALACAS